MKKSIRIVSAAAVGLLTVSPLAACGASNTAGSASTDKPIELNVWAWDSYMPQTVDDFEKANPNIKVKVTNVGSSTEEYMSLNNAIAAGSGLPDAVQIEYYALPQFVIHDDLRDLSSFGADKYADFYTPGTWSSVNINGGVYALPVDSGPLALYYNEEVFQKAGIAEPPKTWDEYYEDAKKIRAVGSYIGADAGDAGQFESLVWQAGGTPFRTSEDNTTVTINLTGDEGTQKVAQYWQKLIDEDLVNTKLKSFTDDWRKSLDNGDIAGLITGGWIKLQSSAPNAAGKWRVALIPQWNEGETGYSEVGGSSLAIPKGVADDRAEAVYKFVDYVTHNRKGIDTRVQGGAFPADKDTLASDSFINQTAVESDEGQEIDYYGGQKFHEPLAETANNVSRDFSYLPFEVYAREVFADTVGAAYTTNTSVADGLVEWQKNLTEYAKNQGFTVK